MGLKDTDIGFTANVGVCNLHNVAVVCLGFKRFSNHYFISILPCAGGVAQKPLYIDIIEVVEIVAIKFDGFGRLGKARHIERIEIRHIFEGGPAQRDVFQAGSLGDFPHLNN